VKNTMVVLSTTSDILARVNPSPISEKYSSGHPMGRAP
jgi:hypothetical protein